MQSFELAQGVLFIAFFVLISGPVHECAHAFAAWKLGDGTAKLFGRVSLDPVRHFDPVGGTLLIASVLISVVSGGSAVGFGWAKPTPVNPYNLRGRYADSIVALAGPLSNVVLAVLFAIGFRILWAQDSVLSNDSVPHMVTLAFFVGVQLNVLLAIFNLIPIAPLDGSHILLDLLDPRTAQSVRNFMNQYGIMLLVLVVFFAWRVLGPIMYPILNFLYGVNFY